MKSAPDQREYWQKEHRTQDGFTRIHSEKPSQPVVELAQFLKEQGHNPRDTHILDIGCGKGRNSIFLASEGFDVFGIDFVPEAIEEAKNRGEKLKNVRFERWDVTEPWSTENESMDVIVDCNATICIPNPGRERALQEAHRALKPGGYYLFYGIAPTAELLDKYPGVEPNSVMFPSERFEKWYSNEELLKTYQDYKLVKLGVVPGGDVIDGKIVEYSMWVALFQKVS